MDDHLKRRVSEFVTALVAEEKERLGSKVTLHDLEGIAVAIGDEITRKLVECELTIRSAECCKRTLHLCPDCGGEFPPDKDLEPVVLRGLRGEVTYLEPVCQCPTCNRAFFPSSGATSAANA